MKDTATQSYAKKMSMRLYEDDVKRLSVMKKVMKRPEVVVMRECLRIVYDQQQVTIARS